MSNFQQKIVRHTKKEENVTIRKGKIKTTETAYERGQILGLTCQDFKGAIISMFEELKDTLLEEVKEKDIQKQPHICRI